MKAGTSCCVKDGNVIGPLANDLLEVCCGSLVEEMASSEPIDCLQFSHYSSRQRTGDWPLEDVPDGSPAGPGVDPSEYTLIEAENSTGEGRSG